MDHLVCDLCGGPLLAQEDVRYEVKVEVKSAYDPLELTREDVEQDHRREIAALLERLKKMDPKAVEAQVYSSFEFDLCMKCQRRYVQDPLRRALIRRVIEPRPN